MLNVKGSGVQSTLWGSAPGAWEFASNRENVSHYPQPSYADICSFERKRKKTEVLHKV